MRLVRHRQALVGRREERHRLDRGHGHLPRLRAGWPLHQPAEDPADKFLRLRLPVLHQPPQQQRPPRPLHAGGSRYPHARLLPPQLHRGPVPELRHHPQPGLYDGAGGARGQAAAPGARLPRLHPSQDHSGRLARAAGRGGPLCRPAQHQRRAADREQPRASRAGEGHGRHPPFHGPHAPAHRRSKGRAEGASLRPSRPEHAAHHRRRCQLRPRYPRPQHQPLRQLRPAPRLFFRVQSHPRRLRRTAAGQGAALARAPALPGRLANAVLRIRCQGAGARRDRQHGFVHGPEAGLGAAAPRAVPHGREPRHPRAAAAGARHGRQIGRSHHPARRHRRLRMDDLARLRLPLGKVAPFIITADHQPGAQLDSAALQQRLTPKPVQTDLFA